MPQLFPPEIIENTVEYYHMQISTKSKIVYILLLILFVCVLILLPLINVDVTSQSRGEIRAPYENIAIQTALYGEIAHYLMFENKSVVKGDTLLILNTDKQKEQIKLIQSQINDNDLFVSDLSSLLNGKPDKLLTSKYRGEYNQYHVKLNEQEINMSFLKKEMDIQEKLMIKKVVADYDFQLAKNNYDKAREQFFALKNEYSSKWLNEQTELLLRNQELQSNILQLQKDMNQYVVLAPATGILVKVAGFDRNNFIAPGQTLAYISSGDSLLVECYISANDIGYNQLGQQVNFQLDAFNYNDWGMLHGHVNQILHDVVIIKDKPVFRVRCTLDNKFLRLKNGYKGEIKKGLTLTARFKLNRRSLWQLLFDKVDNWLNPKLVTIDE